MTWLRHNLALCLLILIQVIGACCCWAELGHEHDSVAVSGDAVVWAADSEETCHEHDDCDRTARVSSRAAIQLLTLDLLYTPISTPSLELLAANRITPATLGGLVGTSRPAICLPLLT